MQRRKRTCIGKLRFASSQCYPKQFDIFGKYSSVEAFFSVSVPCSIRSVSALPLCVLAILRLRVEFLTSHQAVITSLILDSLIRALPSGFVSWSRIDGA
jgi:hypothetical protein